MGISALEQRSVPLGEGDPRRQALGSDHGGRLEASRYGDVRRRLGLPDGKILQLFLQRASEQSKDLLEARRQMLPRFSEWPVKHGDEAAWVRFLRAAGVRASLRPTGGESVQGPVGTPQNLAWTISRTVKEVGESLVSDR